LLKAKAAKSPGKSRASAVELGTVANPKLALALAQVRPH